MGINIIITDGNNVSTIIGAGARGLAPIVSASQINGWTARSVAFFGPPGQNPKSLPPFAPLGGDCLFDTGSLFCFAGIMNSDSDNVLMVLWGFPNSPQEVSGSGQLNPSAGTLIDGSITWKIVLP